MSPSRHDPEQQKEFLSVDGYCQQFRNGKISIDVFRAYLHRRVPRRDIESYVNLNWPEENRNVRRPDRPS